MNQVRNLKQICNLLHAVRQGYGYSALEVTDEMIETMECVYHELKEKGAVSL